MAQSILLEIWKLGGELKDVYFSTKYKGARPFSFSDIEDLYQAIQKLSNRGYLKKIRRSTGASYCFTVRGYRRALELAARNYPEVTDVWDGRWHIIMFDIPEVQRERRDKIRRYLKWNGFWQLHKSVWVSPYRASPELMLLFREIGVSKYCRSLIVERMDYDKDLRRRFRVK